MKVAVDEVERQFTAEIDLFASGKRVGVVDGNADLAGEIHFRIAWKGYHVRRGRLTHEIPVEAADLFIVEEDDGEFSHGRIELVA